MKEYKKRKKTVWRIGAVYAAIFGLLIPATVFLAGFFALAFSNADKILYGVSVSGENLGRLSPQAAEKILDQKIAEWQAGKIKLKYENKMWEITPKETGISIDAQKTINKAYGIGRNKNILKSAADQIVSAIFSKNIAAEVTINDEQYQNFYARTFGKVENKARDAQIKYIQDAGLFEIAKEEGGYEFDKNEMLAELAGNAAQLTSDDVAVKMLQSAPHIKESELLEARKKANAVLARAPFILVYFPATEQKNGSAKAQEYKLDKDRLKDIITFKQKDNSPDFAARLNGAGLKNFLIEISPSINQKSENAVLTVKSGKVTEFALSKNGVELDIERGISEIESELLEGQSSIITLKPKIVQPEIRTDTIENLGLVSLLAVGESDFKGSPASRVFNLTLAANKLNGLLIKPGEEFSFVGAIGEISSKTGYQAGLVIKNGKTVREYGGGVCQVSTTMFRAAIYAGLKITERFPHTLPVQYYNPQGFDATVYGPHPDLRFVNDTPSNILVQTKVKGTKLYFEFYGTPDAREVKVIGPVEYDKKPDGSLKATLTREIYKNSELVTTDIFKSSYRSPIKEPAQKNPLE